MTNHKSHETIESLRSLVGNKLAQATHLLFVFDEEYDYNTPLAVALEFSDGKRSGKITGGSDGFSVEIDLSEMQSVDMQENGKQCIFDASSTPLWPGRLHLIVMIAERTSGIFVCIQSLAKALVDFGKNAFTLVFWTRDEQESGGTFCCH